MRRILLMLLMSIYTLIAFAQNKANTMYTLVAYDSTGTELRRSYGFSFGAGNDIATTYDAVAGSDKIVAIAGGKQMSVTRIAGVNALYNIAKLQVAVQPAGAVVNTPTLKTPAKAKVLVEGKWHTLTLTSNTPFNGYNFYTLSTSPAVRSGMPLHNEKGELIAMVQANATKPTQPNAIDLKAIAELKNTPLSLGDANYKGITIPRSLPPTSEEANAYIYLLLNSSKDRASIEQAVNDFIALYPQDANAYLYKAEVLLNNGNKTSALDQLDKAIQYSKSADEIHYAWAKLLLKNLSHTTDLASQKPVINEALEAANKAYTLKAEPLYALLQADCLMELERYPEAKEKYIEVAHSPMGEAQHFLYATQAQQRIAPDYAIMEGLLTEGLAKFAKPYASVAIPFLMQRALCYQKQGKHRVAVTDLLEAERAAVALGDNKQLKESLYALRYQSAVEAKLYQQALTDAENLVALKPNSCTYRLQRAVIWIVAGERDKALADCQWVSQQCPDNADSYMWQVIIYAESKQKAKMKVALDKLKTLNPALYEELSKKQLRYN